MNTLLLDSPEQYTEFEPDQRRLRQQKPRTITLDLTATQGIIPPFARSYTRRTRKP